MATSFLTSRAPHRYRHYVVPKANAYRFSRAGSAICSEGDR